MDKRANYLALALLDALEDENASYIIKLTEDYGANPNFIVPERHLAPIHFSCGMENVELAENITGFFIKHNADPNLPTPDDGLTPLHIAAMSGRQKIVRMLLEKGGDIDIIDKENRTPLQYAVFDCHFEVIETIKKFVFEKKFKTVNVKDEEKLTDFSMNVKLHNNLSITKNVECSKYTPNRINYNYDVTSPYYVNITHRKERKDLQHNIEKSNFSDSLNVDEPKQCEKEEVEDFKQNQSSLTATTSKETTKKNLFELTEENLKELMKNDANETSRVSLIQGWREKVQQSRLRKSVIYHYDNLENLVNGIIEDENVDFTNTAVEIVEKKQKKSGGIKFDNTAFGKLLNTLRANKTLNSDTSFTTALAPEEHKKNLNQSTFLTSNQQEQFLYQMSEKYQYIDQDEGLVFFEEKLAMNSGNPSSKKKTQNLNVSQSSLSTQLSIPSNYDTEALREELTKLGEPPGPITKTTKRLYTKKLIKYKRNPEKLLQIQNSLNKKEIPNFSIELLKTFTSENWYSRISEYDSFEEEMSFQFKNNHKSFNTKKWREGNLKQSFIYLLIDPRVSNNLPAKSRFSNEHEIWKQFLLSIFYVGKGKSVRPFSHLYDAMKIHMRSQRLDIEEINFAENYKNLKKSFKTSTKMKSAICLLHSPSKSLQESAKLKRILDIWKSEMGVICLHVFHNILPAEAYTREAAIIDAIGLQHLTNLKKGDYYGPASSWTMRKRKCLGVSLLFKAMNIFLSEGESQLFPSDLI